MPTVLIFSLTIQFPRSVSLGLVQAVAGGLFPLTLAKRTVTGATGPPLLGWWESLLALLGSHDFSGFRIACGLP